VLLNVLRIAGAALGALVLLAFAVGCAFMGGTRVAIPVLASGLLATLVVTWVARRSRGPAGPVSWASALRALRRGAEATLAVCGVMAVTGVVTTAFAVRPPRQADVVAQFRLHQPDYEALRDMVRADGLVGVQDGGGSFARESFSFKSPEALGIPGERAADYRRLLHATQCPSINVWSDGAVAFPAAGWGAANRGWRVLLVWSRAERSPLVPSIDGFRKKGRPLDWERAASRIEGDWYVEIVW
jgi:hypothetical protein